MMNRVSKALGILSLVGTLCVLLAGVRAALAQGVVFNCDQADLEQAVAGGGIITFECDGTILITNTIVIEADTTLDATDRNITIASPGATNGVRLFTILGGEDEDSPVTLTLINVKLVDGSSTNGGAVFIGTNAVLDASFCVFSNNVAITTNGLSGSSASNPSNVTKTRGNGGNGGRSGMSAYGGAIYNLGIATFNECSFLTNAVVGGDGGNGGTGGAGNVVGGNGGDGGRGGSAFGGAIYNQGQLFITNSTFNLNVAAGGFGGERGAGGAGPFAGTAGRAGKPGGASGAAVLTQKGYSAVIVNSTFALNGATAGDTPDAGSSLGRGPRGGDGGASSGGGLANYGTNVLVNCTFFANTVAGGSGGNGGDSPVVGGKGGNGGTAWGGNLFSGGKRSVLYATNCTLTDGSAIGGTNGFGGAAPFPGKNGKRGPSRGGNIASSNSVLWLKNTLIAYPAAGTNAYGKFKDGGYNLLSDRSIKFTKTSTSRATNSTSAVNELRIGVLGRNGGPVETIELLTNSPAIDMGDTNNFLLTDARGVLRPLDANGDGDYRSDIGAYEAGKVLGPPRIIVPPVNRTVREDGDVTFNVVAVGDPPLLYQWFHDDEEIPGATASSFTLFGAGAFDEGNYLVRVSNNSGSTTNNPAVTLDVLIPPSFEEEPADTIADRGGTFILEAIAAGDSPLTYQWYFNDVLQLGAVLNTYTVVDAGPTNAGLYRVRVCNPHGCIDSAEAMVTVSNTPPSIVSIIPTNQVVAQGTTARFSALARGARPLGFLWFFNNAIVRTNATGTSDTDDLTIGNAATKDQGSYVLMVTNEFGAATSGPVTLTVQTNRPVILEEPISLTIVGGQTTNLFVTAIGSEPLRYRWFFNSNAVLTATNSFFAITNASTTNNGRYQVIVSNLLGSVTSVVATLTVQTLAPAILSQPTNVTVAAGQTATATVIASGSTPLNYQWYFNGTTPVPGATTPTLTIENAQATNAGSYRVVVTNLLGNATSAPITLNVTAGAGVSINSQPTSQTVLSGQNATFTVGAGGTLPLSYRWYFNSNAIPGATNPGYTVNNAQAGDQGFYHVVVSNLVGGATSVVVTLTVDLGAPVIQSAPESTNAVVGESASMTVTAAGSQPLLYQWLFEGVPYSAPTSSNLRFTNSVSGSIFEITSSPTSSSLTITVSVPDTKPPTYVPPERGTYSVTVTNSYGAVTPDPVTFDVLGL